MFRSGASRSILRSVTTASPASRTQHLLRSQLCTGSGSSPRLPTKPLAVKSLGLVRHVSATGDRKPIDEINERHEREVGKEQLEVNPQAVSTTSSTHPINSEVGARPGKKSEDEDQTEMLGGIKHDLV